MISRLITLLLLAAAATADQGPWTARSLGSYVRARAGSRDRGALLWRGHGSLSNTLTGARIAEVEVIERCMQLPTTGGAGFVSERVLVYRNENGTRLARPLHYAHNVSIQLNEGNLLLRAVGADESVAASGWGVGRGPVRAGWLRRAFEISVRPAKADAAVTEPVPATASPSGWPRTADGSRLRTTREEYRLVESRRPGGACTMKYKRTGRCPTWYGQGVCTLELCACAERTTPWWRSWWRGGVRRTCNHRRAHEDDAAGGAGEGDQGVAESRSSSWARQVDQLVGGLGEER
jgi:hypothetical protein